jgi:hypothetical protein
MPAFVQGIAQSQMATVTFSGPTTAGNCILVFLAQYNTGGGGIPATITDTDGNFYVFVGSQVGAAGNWTQVFVAKNIIGGVSTTVSNSSFGFGTLRDLIAIEYSGSSKSLPIRSDASSYVSPAGANSVTLTYRTGDLIVLFDSGQGIITPPVGYTLRESTGAIAAYAYDGPALSSGTSPISITSDTGDNMLWGVVLGSPATNRAYIFEM